MPIAENANTNNTLLNVSLVFLLGLPHSGHDLASKLICLPHSVQFISVIISL